jgi:hypothetical protein
MAFHDDWWGKAGDQWNDWFRSGGGGGGPGQEFGGLSAADEEFKQMLYDRFGELPDEYESYTGDRFADRSPEELALIKQGQGGHPMFDKASKDLGFAGDVYKTGAEYGVGDLDRDAGELMRGDTYRNEVAERILRDMNRGAAGSGMDLTGKQNFGGTGGGDRADLARLSSNLAYSEKAGDALSNLHFGALRDARGTARQLRSDRETSAGRFGQTALQGLGIGRDKYASRLSSFRDDRKYRDRDLGVAFKDWEDEKNFPYKKLGLGSSLLGNMPIEEKGMSQQPASGGK